MENSASIWLGIFLNVKPFYFEGKLCNNGITVDMFEPCFSEQQSHPDIAKFQTVVSHSSI